MKPITAFWLLMLIAAVGTTVDVIWGPHTEAIVYAGIITSLTLSRVKL